MPRKKTTKAPKKQTTNKVVEAETLPKQDDFAQFMEAVNVASNNAKEEKAQEEIINEQIETADSAVETAETPVDDFAENFVEETPIVEENVEAEPIKETVEEVKEEKTSPKPKNTPKKKNPTMRQVYGYDYMGLIYNY